MPLNLASITSVEDCGFIGNGNESGMQRALADDVITGVGDIGRSGETLVTFSFLAFLEGVFSFLEGGDLGGVEGKGLKQPGGNKSLRMFSTFSSLSRVEVDSSGSTGSSDG